MVDRLTLTVNSRLARWLLFNHSREQEQAGLKIWKTPAIHSIDEWLRQSWLQSWPDQYILTDLQSKQLWQTIIREDTVTPDLDLLHIQGAANHSFKAYQLICKYRLPEDPAGFDNYTEETQTFRRWMTRYRKKLKEWRALDPVELLDAVIGRMKEGAIPHPEKIILHGFDEITPQLQDWLNLLETKNIPIHFEPFEPAPVSSDKLKELITHKKTTVQKYEDANEEVIQCARWIRSVYKEGETIGIVVPEMESYRGILERELQAELAPVSVYPWEAPHIPFNISMGTPLSHEPMVHLALLLLSQRSKRIPLLTFSTLISSPFLDLPDNEIQSRRDFEWRLRGGNTTHVFLPTVLDPAKKKQYPTLASLLGELENWIDDSSSRLPSEWARGISKFLKQVKWPAGHGTLTSHQFQTLESWNECLDSLSSLDRVLQKINRHQATAHLTHIAKEALFQPQTHEEPIQVVGLLESAGMKFDHLWIMGCHAETFPPFPSPNPFLPFLNLQKPFNLPHSTAEWELIFAEQTLFRLAHACTHLVFSYPAWQGETEMAPSPLLIPWLADGNTIQSSTSSKLQDHQGFTIQLEKVQDDFPIPVSPEEKEFIRGGTSLLKNQAECPFRAFAVHRLSSQKKDFPELDMDDSVRGTLIHKILELFWNRVQTSERLHALHESKTLLEQIRQCVQDGMKLFPFDADKQNVFLEIERERLAHLIHEWMEYERERSHFEVLNTETEKNIQLNDLSLTLKVDRIDRTLDGKIILIDYKTGLVSNLKKWFGERIEEPQLPLYSMEVKADAITFANIRKGDSRYRGLSQEENLIPRVNSNITKEHSELETWDDLKNFWHTSLNQLATEFLQGRLTVSPLHEGDACKYCEQNTFCRKTELLNHSNGEEE
jgi:ATP-dependent helicase/nuclease subunit B